MPGHLPLQKGSPICVTYPKILAKGREYPTKNIEAMYVVLVVFRVNIRYRVRTVEYFKFPNLEGAMVWEKGAIRKQENNFF